MRTAFELGQVIRLFKADYYARYSCTGQVTKVLSCLEQCRTSALGGHVDACPECGYVRVSYNSCRDRHCPKCQGMEWEVWIQARKEDLLPVKYFHVVFTLPHELHPLLLEQRKAGFSALFKAVRQTIHVFSSGQRIQTRMIALLHTRGSNLTFHPHLHCIVPAGGLNALGKWQKFANAHNRCPFLLSIKAMSKVFRAKYIAEISKEIQIPQNVRKELFAKPWVVFCKAPFSNRNIVLEYIGRYSHRVAISNSRIKNIDSTGVTFDYRDYKAGGKHKDMILAGVEFLRRFCLHILPKGFVRIRHYGFLSGSNREKLREIQKQLGQPMSPVKRQRKKWKDICIEKGLEYNLCPECKQEQLVTVEIFKPVKPRAPPWRLPMEATNSVNTRVYATLRCKERCDIRIAPASLCAKMAR